MNKDVIYIDVEDDITAIIGKLKASKEKIVALVPPKRIGVLQSAVNLKLLDRTAHNEKKHLVLITSNRALMALAAAGQIPVAKNLQSKPELPEIAALDIDDGEDIIDGAQLPVGELTKTADTEPDSDTDKAAADLIAPVAVASPDLATRKKPKIKKSGAKVPNFNTFRKKLIFGIGGGVLLILFVIWATLFAPRATVVITARTTDTAISQTVTLSETASTNPASKTLRVIQQQQKDTQSVTFTATGTKNVGDKATGTVKLSNNNAGAMTISEGTELSSSSGLTFTTDTASTVPAATLTFGPECGSDHLCPGSASVGVTAAEGGTDYNGASGSLSGAPNGVSASFEDATTGGTDKTAKVVTADDVKSATEDLNAKVKENPGAKDELKAKFASTTVAIEPSFSADKSKPKSSPAVGGEASGEATLSIDVTYTMLAVEKTELSSYLDNVAKASVDEVSSQRVYDNGTDSVSFREFEDGAGAPNVQLIATAKLGPDIKDDEIKEAVKGKQYGDIQADLGSINGVDNVDTKFWPFWVRTVPNDVKRISIEFKLNDQK